MLNNQDIIDNGIKEAEHLINLLNNDEEDFLNTTPSFERHRLINKSSFKQVHQTQNKLKTVKKNVDKSIKKNISDKAEKSSISNGAQENKLANLNIIEPSKHTEKVNDIVTIDQEDSNDSNINENINTEDNIEYKLLGKPNEKIINELNGPLA